ncbi:helix-turn-helix domain-containing protein [Lysinibacillus pakistanensis]|uniref:Helix-turn-helix domain-containing protein n=1 Tax=Lysinibacillus pakistanensis TaxID=759811 RepID=A0AAX3X101_9BACI|nr:helix-turn-helix domain-containing protein [Lysinibacillus pakistanensis]MDM5233099.1 helix-turn-helix domain-containing protein [Lysinibacillus pakistanensis]QGG51223.1 helix-turn-helix domain-containing protein [Lysinibacillus pakistanensis]WHY48583.1 helix-turn-helix domain-containing protein [Lysinibacillus pakistanensis]WHY53596.1 helix-turn-helix domain-containing protein [Lysinibacillus pakistanensis]
MTEKRNNNNLGLLLKEFLKERSLSMRKFSELTGIDTATISRIINNKRNATPQHLEKFADCLGVPLINLFEAAGYPIEQRQEKSESDIHTSVDAIQALLKSSNVYDDEFSVAQVEQKLESYGLFAQTEEGKNTIVKDFDEKIKNVGSVGPFISKLKELYERFLSGKGTLFELTIIGSTLLYFIIPVDVLPDYLFPIGYLDDAIAVQLTTKTLLKNN